MKKIYFLSGLPRAGNTLLASILNQNKNISVTANSPVVEMFFSIENIKKNNEAYINFPDEKSINNVLKNIFNNYYQDWKSDYIIDRSSWGTPDNLNILKKYYNKDIKIIVLVRDVLEILASFIKWSQENKNTFLNQFNTTEEKCEFLMRRGGQISLCLSSAFNLLSPENQKYSLLVEYDNLIADTSNQINEIYSFLDIESYQHSFQNLNQLKLNGIKYDDTYLGKNLHKVKERCVKKSLYKVEDFLSDNIIQKYSSLNFWKN